MYEKIKEDLLDDMKYFGLVSTIIISIDVYESLSNNERLNLEDHLSIGYPLKWLILSTVEDHYSFIYAIEPDRR